MPFIEWTPLHSVNIKEIDEQHKKFIGFINELHDLMQERENLRSPKLGVLINKILEYAQLHFLTEERLMTEYDYPDYALHKTEHEAIFNKLAVLKERFEKEKGPVAGDLIIVLKDWLVDHLWNFDRKYAAFFNEKGVF